MKKVLVAVLLLCIGLVYAGVKNVDDETGQIAFTIYNADSDTASSPDFLLTNPSANKVYDAILGQVYFPDMVGTDTAIGNTDTLIVTWYGLWNYYKYVYQVDTLFPPCTSFFEFYGDVGLRTGQTILGDSTAVLTPVQLKSLAFMNSLKFDFVAIDSAGDGDTCTATLQYWIRKVEK